MGTPTYEVRIKDEEVEAKEIDSKETPESNIETTEATKTEPKEPEVDLSQIKEEVSGEVSKSVIEKIGEALGLTKKEEAALPTNAEELQKVVDAKVQEALESRDRKYQEEQTQTQKAQEARVDGIITGWHTEYDRLAAVGKVPAIKDPDNPEDPGVKARRELILGIGDIIAEERKLGIVRTPALSEVLLNEPTRLKGIPGADLPISGNSAVREEPANYSNKEIRSKTFQQILSEA